MNQKLQEILNALQQSEQFDEAARNAIAKKIKEVEKELEITAFKLERTEKVKRTTAILLEETIEELENKRKAVEAQNRELEIEASLERIRAVAMSMHSGDRLLDICRVLFDELMVLGFTSLRCALIHIFFEGKDYYIDYDYADITGGQISKVPLAAPEKVESFFERIRSSADAFDERVYEGDDLEKLKIWRKSTGQINDPRINDAKELYYYFYSIGSGNIGISTFQKITGKQLKTLQRFRNVFELAYKRYLDVSNAEAQAREAQVEAALERIRSRAMAMRTSDELNLLIGFVFAECTRLNMQLDRGFIMTFDKKTNDSHWWMVGADAPDMPMSILVKYHEYAPSLAILKGWQEREQKWSYVLEGDNKRTWTDYCFTKTGLAQLPDFVKDNMRSVESIILNASFQNFGCIMLSSFEPLTEEHFGLLIRLSKVFDLTYTRFLDLKKAEAQAMQAEKDLIEIKSAKQKAEAALTELQATQKQLIQSEKMASLGELTAGIAHEIQNPLNFVNNFSEVSTELINEMMEEVEKGNNEEVRIIANDIKQNLEKINHHGKRADAIVKGMLQHSRTSTGIKELTDINDLCDEYLRLAFHGLRAKEKSFNAKFETAFDTDIDKINVIPQDVGRVILNMINNAFYAVNEKKKKEQDNYEPTVFISTKKVVNNILVHIADNGCGIDAAIKDKIFQPFFTTKPTGQGTGLGLSLSYDIIKAHGGEIIVTTKEGEGSEFIILLPA